MSLIIALPRECRSGERRVALDPSRVERLQQSGHQVRIETQCGHLASFHDAAYQGVTVVASFADVVREADIVVKVVCPTLEEIALLPSGSVLVCIMTAFQHLEEVEALRARQITVLGMDHLPRTTRAQPMDALSSQATVAGYKAALLAAELSPRLFPMLTTAAGTIRPSRVLVVGAGVAGLQAIATARRLGAQVEAYDIRKAAKEQIESLGARMVDTGVEVEGAGGVARALRKDEKKLQHDVLAEHLARAHVVICAASLPGRRAPRIITEDMVNGMLPESVIVDMAASTGGNCELTRIGEHYYFNDTLIAGPLNLPSHGAVHASEMYARNVHNMLELIIEGDALALDPNDEIISRCVLMHAGQINHPNIAKLLETDVIPFGHVPSPPLDLPAELPDQNSGWLNEESDVREEPKVADATQTSEVSPPSSSQANANAKVLTGTSGEPAGGSGTNGQEGAAGEKSDMKTEADIEQALSVGEGKDSRGKQNRGKNSSQDLNSKDGTSLENTVRASGIEDFDESGDVAAVAEPSDSDIDEQDLRDLAALEGVELEEVLGLSSSGQLTGGDSESHVGAARDAVADTFANIVGDAAQDTTEGVSEETELPHDDLILIEGVGPALQQRLYSFGYRRWQDLAELDDDAIEKLTVRLELGDEVREQDWRGQAQRLMEQNS